jgi:hypothetical protein
VAKIIVWLSLSGAPFVTHDALGGWFRLESTNHIVPNVCVRILVVLAVQCNKDFIV